MSGARLRKAIWATSLPWRCDARVSAHHYAEILATDGWELAFLSHPVSPLHLVRSRSRRQTTERWRNWRAGGEWHLEHRLLAYTPLTLCPPHRSLPLRGKFALDAWPRMTVPNVGRYLRQRGFDDVDLVVLDSYRHGFLLDAVRARKTVLRVVDSLGGFEGTSSAWVERERRLVPRVDHLVVTSKVLAREMERLEPRSLICIPNGAELRHFGRDVPPPPEYASIPPPRAVYAGSLERWLDVSLLRRVAEQLSGVSFVLVGSGGADLSALERLKNVHCLGPRRYEELPSYLRHAQVGLIPFVADALTRCVNPIKLYEYFASGLPVVATAWEEIEGLRSPAALCRTADSFRDAIRSAIERPPPPDQIAAFCAGTDWRDRARRLFGEVLGS
jgi:glycosyltransferase involved in cell wall biosynthesis